MYPTSEAYKEAIKKNVRDVEISGTITLKDDTIINITDKDIVQGSLYVTEQCVAGEDIEVGNVYASEMGLSLSTPLENPYSLDGARILLHFVLDVGGGLREYVPLGYFYVTEIQRKANNVNLTALDGMLLFDIPVGEPGSSSPRNFVVHACEQAGVTLGTSVFEIDTFANAGVLLAAPDASKIKTCRDLLMWACQIMGAFARMNRSGELEIVPIKARPSVKTINKAERFNSDVSDFAIQITKVSMQVGEAEYSRGTDGMTMVLEENPLMTGLSESQINTVLDNLLAQVTQAEYIPCNIDFAGDPALQAGDYVTLTEAGILQSETGTYFLHAEFPVEASTSMATSLVTHSTWRYRGPHNIKGVGKHGLVRGVQNQQMKAVSSIVAIARAAQDLALAANQSTQLIKDAIGGHVLIRQSPDETNEILIMDHPDPDQATKIWRWNMGGLGYSDNVTGADNPDREYDIAMTMDGAINANFIKTGRLGAGVVTIGPETTFAPGYDPSQIEGAVDPLRVDSHCKALFHFDGSINDHRGIMPTFTRDSKAYLSDGTEVEAGAPRFEAGQFGQAVLIEEGCTNIITSWPAGWYTGGGGIVAEDRGVQVGAAGNTIRLTNSGTVESYYYSPAFQLNPLTVYTVQYKYRGTVAPSNFDFHILSSTGTLVQISHRATSISGEWKTQQLTFTTTADITGINQYIRIDHNGSDAGYIEIAEIVLVQKSYPLSFPGYGVTRSPETLTIPTAGVLNPQGPWTIACWAKTNTTGVQWRYLIALMTSSANQDRYFEVCLSASDQPALVCYSGGSIRYVDGAPLSNPTEFHHWAATYDGNTVTVYVDGIPVLSGNYHLEGSFPDHIKIGYWHTGSYQWNGLIDDLAIFDYAATDEEIEAWYEADAPFYALDLPKPELPGYVKIESDGLRVYDNAGKLRGVFGSWLKELIRKYGIKIIDGEIYSTMFQTGEEGASDYIKLSSGYEPLLVVNDDKRALSIWADSSGGFIQFFDSSADGMRGQILPHDDDDGEGLRVHARSQTSLNYALSLWGQAGIIMRGDVWVHDDFKVFGAKDAVVPTENYGLRDLSVIEMPEVKFMDEGVGELAGGICRIDLDPIFLETIEPNTPETPFIVHLTPYDWLDLRVKEIGDTYFIVEEKEGLSGKFSWQLTATRKGYAGRRLDRTDYEDVLISNWEDDLSGFLEQEG